MSKQTIKREGAPVEAPQVPWSAPQQELSVVPDFAPASADPVALNAAKVAKEVDAAVMLSLLDQNAQETSGIEVPVALDNPFVPKVSSNPFKRVEPKKAEAEVEEYEVRDDQPSWGEFVKFVMKHGDQIIQARYPKPMGTVDTLWRGVQVFPHPEVQLRHATAGWVSWEAANAA